MNLKGFVNLGYIVGIALLAGVAGYFVVSKQLFLPLPIPSPISSSTPIQTFTPRPTQPSFSSKEMPFETITKGANSGHDDRKDYVIKEVSQWRNVWNVVNFISTPQPDLPSINFNDEMVIAVFQGSHSTGGYSTEATEILEKDNSLEVLVKETSPSPGSVVTQAFTAPYHIVKTKKVDKEVLFRR